MARFTTTDGCELDYRDDGDPGAARTVVLLHGWSQSRATFDRVIPLLSGTHRVVSYDQRGHGESATPPHGARIARLAADLRELLGHLGVGDAHLVGHSMGASVLWSYVDQWGTGGIETLTIVDQPSACVVLPWLDETTGTAAGAILDFAGAEGFAAAVAGPDALAVRRAFLTSMLSPSIPAADLDWLFAENLKMDGGWGSRLLLDHVMQDWRDVLPRIDVPTLVIGGEVSHVSTESQRWTAEHIAGARVRIFRADEGGSHFAFFEDPSTFAAALTQFVTAAQDEAAGR